MNAELVAIIREELATHGQARSGICDCGASYVKDGHRAHQAERIAARLGIERRGEEWIADEHDELVPLFRVRALEQREETSAPR